MRTSAILLLALLAIVSTGCSAWEARQAALDAPNTDVAGTWTGKTTGDGKFSPITLTLDQTGTDVTGTMNIGGRPDLSGRVKGTHQGGVAHAVSDEPNPFRRNLGSARQHDDE
jgi:hypothetical protein